MNVIFLHPGFPGQFQYLAAFFGKNKENQTLFVTTDTTRKEQQIPGVKKIIIAEKPEKEGQPEQPLKSPPEIPVANFLNSLKEKDFIPDIIIAASGSGMSFYVKEAFPKTPFLSFFDWYYSPDKLQESFKPDAEPELKVLMNLRNKNMPLLADLVSCDAGICPSKWQKSQFPKEFHDKLNIIHDGIDTNIFKPLPDSNFKTNDLDLSNVKHLVTYASNLLAPYMGFDQFMLSLPAVLKSKPDAHVVILGSDRVSFGQKDGDEKKSYKSMILEKVDLDPERVHFIDRLAYEDYIRLLQASAVHIYIDSPLLVSRPLLEALSCGCLVIASDLPPIKEVVKDGTNGIIVDFTSSEKIGQKIIDCLEFPSFMEAVKQKASQTIADNYALEKMVPQQLDMIKKLIKKDTSQGQFG